MKAPSTRTQQRRERAIVPTPEELKARAKLEEDIKSINAKYGPNLRALVDVYEMDFPHHMESLPKWIGTNDRNVVRFFYAFWMPHSEGDLMWTSIGDYDYLKETFSVNDDQVYEAARHFYHFRGEVSRKIGFRLMHFCSSAGHSEATIFVAGQYLKRAHTRPAILRTKEAALALDRLAKVSRGSDSAEPNSENFRALVLQGKFAQFKGNLNSAMLYYRLAMKGAIKFAKQKINPKLTPFLAMQQFDELSSPWIDLAAVYVRLGRIGECYDAYKIGMDLDDPDAFFNKARLKSAHKPEYEYSLDWLYNMSKAAASGNYKAAVYMGDYYADVPAQPPPTKEQESQRTESQKIESKEDPGPPRTIGQRIAGFLLNLQERTLTSQDPRDSLPYYAAYPQTPDKRMKLCLEWLGIAADYMYGPAYLRRARIHLNKYIFPDSNLALELVRPDFQSRHNMAGAIDSPFYDIELAHLNLASVFVMRDMLAENSKITKFEEIEAQQGPWGLFPDVVDANNGQMDAMIEEAKEIADLVGMDVVTKEGAVVYFHQGERGQGIRETRRDITIVAQNSGE